MALFKLKNFVVHLTILIIYFFSNAKCSLCDLKLNLRQTLHNDGYHKNLTYEIQYSHNGKEQWYEGCSVGLELVLPAGVYASPDEIEGSKYKTTTIFKSKVNIELLHVDASPITVHLLGLLRNDTTVMFIPLHARYHTVESGGGYATVEIPPPRVFLNCGQKILEHCPPTKTYIHSFCPKGTGTKCFWTEVPIQVSKPLQWPVPRGDLRHHGLVMLGTAAVVAYASIYLMKEMDHFKRRWQRSLRERR